MLPAMNQLRHQLAQRTRTIITRFQWWAWHRHDAHHHCAACDDGALHRHVRSTVVDDCIDEGIVELVDLLNLNGIVTSNSCQSACNGNLLRHAHHIDLYFRTPNDLGAFMLLMAAHGVELIAVSPGRSDWKLQINPAHGSGKDLQLVNYLGLHPRQHDAVVQVLRAQLARTRGADQVLQRAATAWGWEVLTEQCGSCGVVIERPDFGPAQQDCLCGLARPAHSSA